ncbi:MAG: hypothetical protein ACTH2Y_14245 [Corynebacterium sp.]|uniref:hypothetical protein n=1 Tax=Corynebacterium sp. TaxID=1720 RepID=UPI003F8E72B1
MPDQTPVTIDDRRKAHEWARMAADNNHDPHNVPWRVAARLFLDHVPAPPKTLAGELRELNKGDIPLGALLELADRVEAVEKENRAALNHAYDERDEALVERDEARTKVEEVEGHLSKSWRQRDAKDVELERLSREREQQEKALVEHGRLLAEARAAFDEVENRNLNLEADLDLIAAAPELAQTIAGMEWQWSVERLTEDGSRWLIDRPWTCDRELAETWLRKYDGSRLVRRLVGPAEPIAKETPND